MSHIRARKTLNQQPLEAHLDFAKLGKGAEIPKDSVMNLGKLNKSSNNYTESRILSAIANKDYKFLREASNYFYEVSGIYSRLVRYLSNILTYDWMITPYINDQKESVNKKVLQDFSKILSDFDNLNAKSTFSEISLEVVKQGVYYGYRRTSSTRQVIQQLPADYCRSRYKVDGLDIVEFNVKYFDDQIRDINQRLMILKSFPKEFQKGYLGMKNGTLPVDKDDNGYWIALEPNYGVKFELNGGGYPIFLTVIPDILQLDKAKELYSKKSEQELLKIIIQKMPLTNDGELIFDIDEAADMHTNAVRMLSKAVGVDVLTTFADTKIDALVDKNSSTAASDPLGVVTQAIFNESGVSQQLFATDGNLALEKSILNDESIMFNLLAKYENWLNYIIDKEYNKNPKKYYFKISMPRLSIYNFKDMVKLYKEQATLGYSKMLPAIAMGQSQSSILATAYFENEVLDLSTLMQPLQMSSTQSDGSKGKGSKGEAGRPEKEDSEKSEKTIANITSQS